MRHYLAWSLLLLVSLQWVGGRLVYEVLLTDVLYRQMSGKELAVSEMVRSRTGLDAHIEIVEEDQAHFQSLGYSNFFLFSEEVDGEQVNFTLKTDPTGLTETPILAGPGSEPEEDAPGMVLVKRFFSDFPVCQTRYNPIIIQQEWPGRNYLYCMQASVFIPTLLAPPPESAG